MGKYARCFALFIEHHKFHEIQEDFSSFRMRNILNNILNFLKALTQNVLPPANFDIPMQIKMIHGANTKVKERNGNSTDGVAKR